MGIFKNKRYEAMFARLSLRVAELERKLEELEKSKPAYEDEVLDGVNKLWNKTLRGIIDYDPMSMADSFKEVDDP